LGGIRQTEISSGYKELVIKPEVVGDLTYVNTTFETPYGQVSTHWEKTAGLFVLQMEIPANTAATIYLPVAGEVMVNGTALSAASISGLLATEVRDGKAICKTGSGKYIIQVKL